MNQLLEMKKTVQAQTAGVDCTIEKFLGGGGQGEVYQVSMAGTQMALKWYFPHMATPQQSAILEKLVKMGPPDQRFLWPEDLASSPTVDTFGYLMRLRPERFKSMFHLMNGKIDPSFRTLATVGYQLADSYYQLHAKGLCYRDISFGNVFFDPDTGEVLVCDNDNVTVDGQGDVTIEGTPRFMAPELVRGDTGAVADRDTDLFSLAVLLFYMFMIHHPLEGKKESEIHCFDLPAMRKLYGTEAVFIFDPSNDTNRPVAGLQDNALIYWPLYPQALRDRFTQAFTHGLHDASHGRVGETVWRREMIRLRDSIIYCTHCAAQNFYDVTVLQQSGAPGVCWSCGQQLQLPPRLRIGNEIVMLNHDTQLYPHHTGEGQWDFSRHTAEISQHPSDPSLWGLKNLSRHKWTSITPDGTMQDVDPGRSVRLAVGTRIQFGTIEGEIRT